MAQSYLIFTQAGKIEIRKHAGTKTILRLSQSDIPLAKNTFKPTMLFFLGEIEKGRLQKIELHTPDVKKAFKNVKTCYDKFIVAAGGLVQDDKGKLLMIYRNGKWDLPKGKLEKGEKPAAGALREVQEETGLKKVKVLSEFQRTYHTYIQDEKRILKETVWYFMQAKDKETTPQQEEGITDIQWISRGKSAKVLANTYDNILLLLKPYFKA